jgi:hypothetical protein
MAKNIEVPEVLLQPLSGKKGQPIVPKINSKYDELVPVNMVLDNPEQDTIYSNTSRENFDRKAGETMEDAEKRFLIDFASNIIENGLEQIPVVMKFICNTLVFKSGHTRARAFRLMGATHIPVTISEQEISYKEYCLPENYQRRLNDVLGSNMFDKERQHVPNLANQIFQAMDKYEEMNSIPMPQHMIEALCKKNGLKKQFYTMARTLLVEAPQIWKQIRDMNLSLTGGYNEYKALTAAQKNNNNMPQSSAGDSVFSNKDNIFQALSAASNLMKQLTNVEFEVGGKKHKFLSEIQTNIRSGVLHEAIVKSLKHVLTQNTKRTWDAPIDLKYDLKCDSVNVVIDVKTRVKGSKNWTCSASNRKSGYYLFVETSESLNRWFVGYAYVKAEDWDKKQQVGLYSTTKLINNDTFQPLHGDIDNGEICLEKLEIN